MLKVDNISFGYSEKPILKSISFQAERGEHISIVGQSGSGKTTLLKLLYGEFDLNQGQMYWGDIEILGPKYNLVIGLEFMKYVSQEFELVPYFTVEETVGKHLSNFYLKEKARRIKELLSVVELSDFSKTKIAHLSGGQKQRVSIAMALAKQPEILLLDEPFSHIDNFKKQSLRDNLFGFLKNEKVTCIVATHDKDDVLQYSDTMLVLQQGKLIAKDSPKQLYNTPKNPIIASFFSEYNNIPASLFFSNKKGSFLIYSNELKKASSSPLEASVEKSMYNGKNYLIHAQTETHSFRFEHNIAIPKGTRVCLDFSRDLAKQRYVKAR